MTEDSWMKCEREYFTSTVHYKYKLPEKDINKLLCEYNVFLQKALLGESPFVAEDLRITILKGGKSDTESEDRQSGESDREAKAVPTEISGRKKC